MKNDTLFFDKKIDFEQQYKYSDEYLRFLITQIIFESYEEENEDALKDFIPLDAPQEATAIEETLKEYEENDYISLIPSFDNILQKLELIYGNHAFPKKKIIQFMEDNFIVIGQICHIDELTEDIFRIYKKNVQQIIDDANTKDEGELFDELIGSFGAPFCLSSYYIMSATSFLIKRNEKMQDLILFNYYKLLINYQYYFREIKKAINAISTSYDNLPIELFISDATCLKVLYCFNIKNLVQFRKLPIEDLIILLYLDFDNYSDILLELAKFSDNFNESYKDKINDVLSSLSEKEYYVLSLRYGFSDGIKATLEEIGQSISKTREMVRQIENNSISKLLEHKQDINLITYLIQIQLFNKKTTYIDLTQLYQYFNSKEIVHKLIFLFNVIGSPVQYDEKIKILYDSSRTSVNIIIEEVLANYNDIIYIEEYNKLKPHEQIMVNYSYYHLNDETYVKKDLKEKDIVVQLIDELFPDGFHINSQKDYEVLKAAYQNKYRLKGEFYSQHSLEAFIGRSDFCLVDRGVHKMRYRCVKLPQKLVDSIIHYIETNGPAVYYRSIYAYFEEELNALGVYNYFYLKGLIDPYLPDNCIKRRSEIQLGKKTVSARDKIVNYMREIKDAFSFDELISTFPGIAKPTWDIIIDGETKNGLIKLESKKYVYFNKTGIKDEAIEELKSVIDYLFVDYNCKTISAHKLFSILKKDNPTLLERLNVINDSYALFSLVYVLFNNQYSVNRPLISKESDETIYGYTLINNFIRSQDSFDNTTISNYVNRVQITGLYSYLEFMEEKSDDFVQINISTMVSKDKFDISNDQLKKIDDFLIMFFDICDSIDLSQFHGYSFLPELSYPWNKYLLVGIIRSYFSNKYTIKNTTGNFKTTDFIIEQIVE